ncbi:ribonuclease III [Entomospira culicis]|uniref:Ribonuclease 3 n=1 Tax=Entomospira culicis TaxID=2719989 RepID=A0A968GHB6_9SPIO|nr:ribonuclease III [Entomospira culicis]NIZ18424.1 ribonuclease III [Entomospira culicis]NIZ68640.1 ribonuclease III [Entomospira culicis]WDI37240.1 ribonuclease III [Entomospira culicis]WDI38868.1 ribonuclease III [Entomospira culicis]
MKHQHHTLLKHQQSLLQTCQEKFKISFFDKSLLLQALSHSSYANEQRSPLASNERLEFLGDAVLDLVMVEYLFHQFPEHSEGLLTRMKANLVCEAMLAKIAQHIDLGRCLLLNKGEERDGGRQKSALLADAMEALFGALYLDQGLNIARIFILQLYQPYFHDLAENLLTKDAKSKLNECRQKGGNTLPEYRVIREWGDDHAKQYEVGIFFDETLVATGTGQNKKEASQDAAHNAYQHVCKGMKHE